MTVTNDDGDLDKAEVVRAMLQYKITPIAGIGESPAQIIFGTAVKDSLPTCKAQQGWIDYLNAMEIAERRNIINKKVQEKYDNTAKNLDPLEIGDIVLIQNVTGNHPNRWDTTGTVVEALDNRQYSVRMDGSRRIRLRNRRHLRKVAPLQASGMSAPTIIRRDRKTTSMESHRDESEQRRDDQHEDEQEEGAPMYE